ncbi:MAG: S8 family serine peptidase [Bacteroidales bacterium]|nr:S8 family serine peptidase [Bacteroidales bacterium]
MKKALNMSCILMLLLLVIPACRDINNEYLPENEITTSTRASVCDLSDHYLCGEEKIPVQKVDNKFYVLFYSDDEVGLMEECAKAGIALKNVRKKLDLARYTTGNLGQGAEKFTNLMAASIEWCSYEQAAPILSSVLYHSPFYKVDGGEEMQVTETFIVILKPGTSLEQLEKLANDYSVEMIGWDSNEGGYASYWYHFACTNLSKGNALEMANLFYSSGLFESAFPDFIAGRLGCIDELFFNTGSFLWHLGNNDVNPQNHINYCAARSIMPMASSNIIVAVIDSGVEVSHPEFDRVLPGWDATTQTSPNRVRLGNNHGTMVTGFIVSKPNNVHLTAGVGYGATILPISCEVDSSGAFVSSSRDLERAINYAVANGADVINCSWGSTSSIPTVLNAIYSATKHGRGGKGCVVLAGTGNDNAANVRFPANLPNVIGVGGVGRGGHRYVGTLTSGSNYGVGLDVVAPGALLVSTSLAGLAGHQLGGNWSIDTGTSFAVPQVSGVAALMLSNAPDLWGYVVGGIIKNTAQNLGYLGYVYDINGWNSAIGHGLLDAFEAVNATFPINKTIDLGFEYNSGPIVVNCNGFPLSPGTSLFYQVTNQTGNTITQTISVGNSYIIEIEQFPSVDAIITGDLTSNVVVTYYLGGHGPSIASTPVRFRVW